MTEKKTFFDMLSACRENFFTSTSLQGILKTLMGETHFLEIRNSNSNNKSNFKSNLKTTTNHTEIDMSNKATMETIDKKKIGKATVVSGTDDAATPAHGAKTATYEIEVKEYWENININSGSDSESDDDTNDNWETVEKKMKKKKHIKKIYTDMHVKKNDIKHTWNEMNELTVLHKAATKAKETESNKSALSNIEKFHHQKRAAKKKTSNNKDLIKYMLEIGKTNSSNTTEEKHTPNMSITQEVIPKPNNMKNKNTSNETNGKKLIGDKRKITEKDDYENNNKIIALTDAEETKKVEDNESATMDYSTEREKIDIEEPKGKATTTLESIFNALSKRPTMDLTAIGYTNQYPKLYNDSPTDNIDNRPPSQQPLKKAPEKMLVDNSKTQEKMVHFDSNKNNTIIYNNQRPTGSTLRTGNNITSNKQQNIDTQTKKATTLALEENNQKPTTTLTETEDEKETPTTDKQKEDTPVYIVIDDTEINHTTWNITVMLKGHKEKNPIRSTLEKIMNIIKTQDDNVLLIMNSSENIHMHETTATQKIPEINNEINKFIEDPRVKNNNKMMFQIRLGSKTDLEEKVLKKQIKNWLSINNIKMTINNLTTNRPMFAGFYDEPNPEQKKIKFLESRIKSNLKWDEIEFQIEIVPIYSSGRGNICPVYMVLTNKEDVQSLRNKLSVVQSNTHTFYQWDHYEDLSRNQKTHMIKKQQQNNNKYRSQLIGGFNKWIQIHRDEDEYTKCDETIKGDIQQMDEISNIEEDDEDEYDKKMPPMIKDKNTITDTRDIERFLKSKYKTNYGESIIQGIIGPTNGYIQVWYLNTQCNQTESLLKVLDIELGRSMDNKTLHDTFENPIEIEEMVYQTKPWEPTKLLMETPEDYEEKPTQKSAKKRYNNQIYFTKENLIIEEKNNRETQTEENSKNQEQATTTVMSTLKSDEIRNDKKIRADKENENHNMKNELQDYCKRLIEQSTSELKKDIKKNTEEIKIVSTNSKKGINDLHTTILDIQEENKSKSEKQQYETKTMMENIQNTQEIMMGYLSSVIKSYTNNNTSNESNQQNVNNSKMNTSRSNTEYTQSYMHESDDESKNDSPNNTYYREPPSRTATPLDDNMSCGETRSPAAGQQ
jgi:hypothetical protein